MLGMAGMSLSQKAMRQQIASALTAVVQVGRLSDGKRKVLSLSEITGLEGDVITMQDIFVFRQTGVQADGQVSGRFHATGVRPKFLDRLSVRGVGLADDLFDPGRIFD